MYTSTRVGEGLVGSVVVELNKFPTLLTETALGPFVCFRTATYAARVRNLQKR